MVSTVSYAEYCCVSLDISIAAVDLLQEMTDVEADEDNEDAINAFFDALVCITFSFKLMLRKDFMPYFMYYYIFVKRRGIKEWSISLSYACLFILDVKVKENSSLVSRDRLNCNAILWP